MPNDEPAAAKPHRTKLRNRASPINASANRRGTTGIAANTARATKRLIDLEPVIRAILRDGKTSPSQIAAELNERRIPAARGGKWSGAQVARAMSRLAAL
jgi:hypothetical protein